ncbi:MAG: hypothetical protein AB1793_04040 [Candidatus Thermoplasmatota archaeon]
MCGRRSRDDGAQLALLDAMVFFAVSTVICGVMTSYAGSHADGQGDALLSSADPDSLLSVYLEASLGGAFVVDALGLELTGQERFGELLLLLAGMALDGRPMEPYGPLLARCGEVLASTCLPWSSCISVCCDDGAQWVTLMVMGQEPDGRADVASASQSLGVHGQAALRATLVLSPPLLPHLG